MIIIQTNLTGTYKQRLVIVTETGTYELTGEQLEDALIDQGQMCRECYDTGEVTMDENNKANIQGVGTETRPCPHKCAIPRRVVVQKDPTHCICGKAWGHTGDHAKGDTQN